jgi:hypothetical protein
MKDLGEVKYMLGMRIRRENGMKYIEQVLKKFEVLDCKPISTPIEPGKKLLE